MCKDKSTLLKRARRKYVSTSLALHLHNANEGSPLRGSYMSTYHCTGVLKQSGNKITSSYCKQRWCAVCGSIKTAKAINGYLPQLKELRDSYFVTLTKKTVLASELTDSMATMEKAWRQITDTARKAKRPGFKGLRKSECTVRPGGRYHYHFHVLVDGKENAEWLVREWLTRLGELADPKAQDIRQADQRSYVELFKYATKLVATSKDNERGLISFKRLDVVFRALRGKKTFYPFGGLRATSEEIEELQAEEVDCLENKEQLWIWEKSDWVNNEGELLTKYRPSEEFKKLFDPTIEELLPKDNFEYADIGGT